MALAMPSFYQRTTICLSNAKPISKYSSVPPPNGSAMRTCKFITSRLHHHNSSSSSSMMMWSLETHRTMQTNIEFLQQKRRMMHRAIAEEEDTQVAEEEDTRVQEQAVTTSVVSQSDKLTMFFKAIGTLDDSSVMKVTEALEGLEDVSNVKVETVETITTVELVKQTTVQATGVASALVEQLQGMDFKLNNLSLRFEDEEEDEEEELRRSMLMDTSSSKV